MKETRRALRIQRNELTDAVEISACVFLWADVYMIEDDSDNKVGYGKPMTWIRTELANFYIDGAFDDVAQEFERYHTASENVLLFTRN